MKTYFHDFVKERNTNQEYSTNLIDVQYNSLSYHIKFKINYIQYIYINFSFIYINCGVQF